MTKASEHYSDCATHNMPAYPNGPCDCGATKSKASEMADKLNKGDYSMRDLNAAAELLRQQEAVIRQMLHALSGIVRVADRNTVEFDSARNAMKSADEVLK